MVEVEWATVLLRHLYHQLRAYRRARYPDLKVVVRSISDWNTMSDVVVELEVNYQPSRFSKSCVATWLQFPALQSRAETAVTVVTESVQ